MNIVILEDALIEQAEIEIGALLELKDGREVFVDDMEYEDGEWYYYCYNEEEEEDEIERIAHDEIRHVLID